MPHLCLFCVWFTLFLQNPVNLLMHYIYKEKGRGLISSDSMDVLRQNGNNIPACTCVCSVWGNQRTPCTVYRFITDLEYSVFNIGIVNCTIITGLTSLHWHLAFPLINIATRCSKGSLAQLQMTGLNPAERRPLGDLQEGDHLVWLGSCAMAQHLQLSS